MDIARLMRIHLPSLPSLMSLSAISSFSPVLLAMSSPPKMSSSRETPNVWDMAMTTSMSGRLRPFSQLETAWRVTPRRDANCSCVRPARMRTALTLSPNPIGSSPLLDPASPGRRLRARKHSLLGQYGTTEVLSCRLPVIFVGCALPPNQKASARCAWGIAHAILRAISHCQERHSMVKRRSVTASPSPSRHHCREGPPRPRGARPRAR